MRLRGLWIVGALIVVGCSRNRISEAELAPVDGRVMITVDNARSPELIEPIFYLIGDSGHQIWLGRVPSSSRKLVKVNKDRLVENECFTTVVHFGKTIDDLRYPKFCWKGESKIDISLNPIISTSTAWSHR